MHLTGTLSQIALQGLGGDEGLYVKGSHGPQYVLQAKENKAAKHSSPSCSIATEQLSVPLLKLHPLVLVVAQEEEREVNNMLLDISHQFDVGVEEQVVQEAFQSRKISAIRES